MSKQPEIPKPEITDQEAFEYTSLVGKPAYGRSYKSTLAIIQDWEADLDFVNITPGVNGKYFNKSDALRMGVDEVLLSNRKETINATWKPGAKDAS